MGTLGKKMVLVLALALMLQGCATVRGWFGEESAFLAENTPAKEPDPDARSMVDTAKGLWKDGVCQSPDQALAFLDAALKRDPEYTEALIWRGKALGDLGYHADAFDDLTRAIRLHPTAQAYAERGLVGLRTEKLPGAQKDLDYAAKLDPKLPETYVYRSGMYFLQGDAKKACRDLKQACELSLCSPLEQAKSSGLC